MAKQEIEATQKIIEIEGIENGTVVLKNGGLRKILMVSGVNFDLKSEEEQGIITFGYQNFLNSLNFSVQIFIHSRKLNIEDYLTRLEERGNQETNELLKNQISEYREFIRSFVSENAIMEKTFFVIVPFDPISLPSISEGVTKKLFGLLSGRKPSPEEATKTQEEKLKQRAKNVGQLELRVNQVISGLNLIGLQTAPLDNEQTIELFYNLYNPEEIEKKTLEIAKD